MKGYKAFDKNLICRGMQYEIGKVYELGKGYPPICCRQGFHFCKSIVDCYTYYPSSEDTRICEVEALGEVVTDDEIKYCTNVIKIVKEVKKPREKSNASTTSSGYCNSGNYNSGNWNSGDRNSGDYNNGNYNSGDYNSGYFNSGNCNSGNCNSGYFNSGNYNIGNYNSGNYNSGNYNSNRYNSGNCNSGYFNSGNYNIGNYNSGDRNSGNYNSGYYNSGNRNSGDWNSGNCNSGLFNTSEKPTIKMFDKESNWTIDDWAESRACSVMNNCPYTYSDFIDKLNMTAKEKECHPEYKTIGGYVKVIKATAKDRQKWWDNLLEFDKQSVYDLPNFDADKFRECTGIEVRSNVPDLEDMND